MTKTIFVTEKEDKLCEDCKHFYQHYIRSGSFFLLVNAGHCVYPRIKSREAKDTCQYFERKMSSPNSKGGC